MGAPPVSIYDATFRVIDALERAGVPYMVVGSLSSMYYSISRSTIDADFVIELGDKRLGDVVSLLGPAFKLDPQMSFKTVTGTRKNVLDVVDTPFDIELFRLSNDAHDQERFRRRCQVAMLGRLVWIPAAEDVIIMKLRWMRAKDREDVRNVLAVQGNNLDFDYIHRWCDEHGTRAALDEIRKEVPEI